MENKQRLNSLVLEMIFKKLFHEVTTISTTLLHNNGAWKVFLGPFTERNLLDVLNKISQFL